MPIERRRHGGVARSERGITGLETAIILIAFMVVASVFAFTVLSIGIFASERSKETVFAGLQEAGSSLEPRGSVIAFRGKVGSTETIYKLTFVVSNATGVEPIDLTPPYTSNDTALDPDVVTGADYKVVISYTDQYQFLSDLPWTVTFVANASSDNLLETGEKAEITVWLLDRDNVIAIGSDSSVAYMDGSGGCGGGGGMTSTATVLTPNDRFTIAVKPPVGATLTVRRSAPARLDAVMDLK